MDPVERDKLFSTLDINKNLDKKSLAQLNKIVTRRYKAFALDGKIGHYTGTKFNIKLLEEAQPISLPPYHASPEGE
jgi:hypothetical protein